MSDFEQRAGDFWQSVVDLAKDNPVRMACAAAIFALVGFVLGAVLI